MAQFIKKKKGWSARFYLDEKDENGTQKRAYLSGYGTKKEAEKAMIEYLQEYKQNGYRMDDKTTVKQYFEYWFDNYVMKKVSPSTQRRYAEIIRLHILPAMGSMQLNSLKSGHIQKFYNDLQEEKGLSKSTVLKVHRILHKAFNTAMKWGFANMNITETVEAPKADESEMNILSENQLKNVLNDVKDKEAYIAILIASSTGMRLGEVCGLQNEDVDIKNGAFYIKHSYKRINGEMVLSKTKTHRSKRPVTMLIDTMDILKSYTQKQKVNRLKAGSQYKENNFFCSWADGRPLLPDYVSKIFRKSCRKLGYENVRFHDLRHTHASILLKKGVHPKVVQERLGHAKIEITLNTYSHVIPNLQKEVLNDIKISSFADLENTF